jgi:hypothetical protein
MSVRLLFRTVPTGTISLAIADLEGSHLVRVAIHGAIGSPRVLGTLHLDRTAPRAERVSINPNVDGAGTAELAWTQTDGGLSGTTTLAIEANTSPVGDALGAWVPFDLQPIAGDGPRAARVSTAILGEGRHLVRIAASNAAGNSGAQPLGVIVADRRPPVVTDVRVLRAPTGADRTVEPHTPPRTRSPAPVWPATLAPSSPRRRAAPPSARPWPGPAASWRTFPDRAGST